MDKTDLIVYNEIRGALKVIKNFKKSNFQDEIIIKASDHLENSIALNEIEQRKEKRNELKRLRNTFLNTRIKHVSNMSFAFSESKLILKTIELVDEIIFWFKTEKINTTNLTGACKKYMKDMDTYSIGTPAKS